MAIKLGPPPDPKDPRFLQWLAMLWEYVVGQNSSSISAMQVMGKKEAAGFPSSLVNADSERIIMHQVFGG